MQGKGFVGIIGAILGIVLTWCITDILENQNLISPHRLLAKYVDWESESKNKGSEAFEDNTKNFTNTIEYTVTKEGDDLFSDDELTNQSTIDMEQLYKDISLDAAKKNYPIKNRLLRMIWHVVIVVLLFACFTAIGLVFLFLGKKKIFIAIILAAIALLIAVIVIKPEYEYKTEQYRLLEAVYSGNEYRFVYLDNDSNDYLELSVSEEEYQVILLPKNEYRNIYFVKHVTENPIYYLSEFNPLEREIFVLN